MSESEVTIAFAPTPGELWSNSLAVMSRRPKRMALHFAVPVGIGVVVAAIAGSDLEVDVVTTLVYILVYWTLLLVGTYFRCRNWMVRQPRTMSFSDSGVLVTIDTGETRLAWKAFAELRPRPRGHVLTMARSRLFYWIPSRAFSSPQDEATFVEIVRSHLSPSP